MRRAPGQVREGLPLQVMRTDRIIVLAIALSLAASFVLSAQTLLWLVDGHSFRWPMIIYILMPLLAIESLKVIILVFK